MMDWIKSTAKTQAKDTKVIWRAAVLHHPMFALYYDDYVKIVENFLPILRTYGYDFYFAGMEHQLNYANFPLDEPGNGRSGRKIDENIDSNTNCHKRSEFWIRKGPEAKSHTVIATQGEFVHQVTVGASGKTTYPICEWNMQMSHGSFIYGESKYNGFALVHVTKGKVDVKLMGVEHYKGLPPKTDDSSAKDTTKVQKKSKKHHKKAAKKEEKPAAPIEKPVVPEQPKAAVEAPKAAPAKKEPEAFTVSLMNLRQSMLRDYGFGKENIDDEYNEVYNDYRALEDKIARDLPNYTPEEDDGKNDIF